MANTNLLWHREENAPHEALFSTCRLVEDDQAGRLNAYKTFSSLYLDRRVSGFAPGQWRIPNRALSKDDSIEDRPYTYNVVRSCIDTAAAKICLSNPMPRFLPSVADEELKQQTAKVERYVWGVIQSQNAHAVGLHAWRSGLINGDGYLYIRSDNGRIVIEALHPSCVIADDNSALGGDLRDLFVRNWYDRAALIAMFPEAKDALELAPMDAPQGDSRLYRDLVKVVEGWHLPCGDEPGRYVMAAQNVTLLREEWDCPRFPIVPMHWSRDLLGWHGRGLAEELQGIQLEISSVIDKISGNMEHLAVPYVAIQRGSEVQDADIDTNEPYKRIPYNGNTPPQVVTPPAVNEQVFQYLETLVQRAFEFSGISLLSATSQKPAGLYSGVALINYIDVESVRFSPQEKTWNQAWVEVAKRIVDCARRTPNLKAVSMFHEADNVVERITPEDLDWDFDDDMVEVQIYPSSSLPKTLAGRAQLAIELVQGGVFDRNDAASIIGSMHPDTDKAAKLNSAPYDDLVMVFEHILKTGEYIEPKPFQDLALGIKLATRYWSRANVNHLDEERIGLLEMWLDEAAKLLNPPAPPPDVNAAPLGASAPPPPPPQGSVKAMPPIPSPGPEMIPGLQPQM